MKQFGAFLLFWVLTIPAFAQSENNDALKLVTWNIANLHHENDVPLRDRSEPRD